MTTHLLPPADTPEHLRERMQAVDDATELMLAVNHLPCPPGSYFECRKCEWNERVQQRLTEEWQETYKELRKVRGAAPAY